MKHPASICPRRLLAVISVLASCLAWPVWASGEPAEETKTLNGLWQLQQEIDQDIEALRVYMGFDKSRQLLLEASNVQPADYYAQVLEFHRKAGQFRFDHMRELPEEPSHHTQVARFLDSQAALEHSRRMIRQVMEFYGLPNSPINHAVSNTDIEPRDLFRAVRQAGRQLNLMLDEQLSPSDTYMTIIRAIGLASNLLAVFPTTERIPPEAPFEAGKTPQDVWDEMLECLTLIDAIYQEKGITSVRVSVRQDASAAIRPVDVNDLANLLAARLKFLAEQDPRVGEPLQSIYPGRKFPSHVFVKAKLLHAQLENLLHLTTGSGE